jgi:hypothetical protein
MSRQALGNFNATCKPAGQQRRERPRLEAAGHFARRDAIYISDLGKLACRSGGQAAGDSRRGLTGPVRPRARARLQDQRAAGDIAGYRAGGSGAGRRVEGQGMGDAQEVGDLRRLDE